MKRFSVLAALALAQPALAADLTQIYQDAQAQDAPSPRRKPRIVPASNVCHRAEPACCLSSTSPASNAHL